MQLLHKKLTRIEVHNVRCTATPPTGAVVNSWDASPVEDRRAASRAGGAVLSHTGAQVSDGDVKRAFRHAALRWHPDRLDSLPPADRATAHQRFQVCRVPPAEGRSTSFSLACSWPAGRQAFLMLCIAVMRSGRGVIRQCLQIGGAFTATAVTETGTDTTACQVASVVISA